MCVCVCVKSGFAVLAHSQIAGKFFASLLLWKCNYTFKKSLALSRLPLLAELAKQIHVAIKPELQKLNLA